MNQVINSRSRTSSFVLAVLTSLTLLPSAFAQDVRQEAQQVARDSRQAYSEAQRQGYNQDQQALRDLQQLSQVSDRFARYLQQNDFNNLQSVFYRVEASAPRLQAYYSIQYLLQRVSSGIDQLSYSYQSNGGNNGNGNGGWNPNQGHHGHGQQCHRVDSYGNCLDYCQHIDEYGNCRDNDPNYGGGSNQRPQGHPGCYRYDSFGNCLDRPNGLPGNLVCSGPPENQQCYESGRP